MAFPDYHDEMRDGTLVRVCDACGGVRYSGDWPLCPHPRIVRFGHAPMESYVDENLTTDPAGVEVTTWGQKLKLMDKEALVPHNNRFVTHGRVYLDLGRSR